MIAAACAFGAGLVVALVWSGRHDRDADAAAVRRWDDVSRALGGDRR